jgi:hypothetical protein
MSLKDWLEISALTSATLTAIAGGVLFVTRARRENIAALHRDLIRKWTNEGCVDCDEQCWVEMELNESEGFIIGLVTTSRHEKPLSANAKLHWGHAILSITEWRRNYAHPIGEVRVTFGETRHRLMWKLVGDKGCEDLPHKTELWPSNV